VFVDNCDDNREPIGVADADDFVGVDIEDENESAEAG